MGVTHVDEWLPRRIEIGGVSQDLGPTRFIQLIASPIAVTEEGGGPALQVVLAQFLPLRSVLQLNRERLVLMGNEVLPWVPAIHAYQAVEHRFEVAAAAIPVYRPDNGPGVRQIEAAFNPLHATV